MGVPLTDKDTWHLFETHFQLNETREGKSYKSWLFARVERSTESAEDTLLGGATLIMRDVVREYLRREYLPARVQSLQSQVGGTDGEIGCLEDFIPGFVDPGSEPAMKELRDMAEEYAFAYFEQLSFREKAILLAKELSISLANPCVEAVVGCKKTITHSVYRACLITLAGEMRRHHPDDDLSSIRVLTGLVFDELGELAMEWGKCEKRCAGFFLLSEQHETLAEIENIYA